MDKKIFYLFCLAFVSVSFGFLASFSLVSRIAYTLDANVAKWLHFNWFCIFLDGLAVLAWALLAKIASVRDLFIANCFGFSFSSLLFSVASTFQVACATQLLTGIFASSFIPLAMIVIGNEVPAKEKGKCSGILLGLSCLSALLGAGLGVFLFWRKLYLIPSCLGAVTFFLALKQFKEYDYRKLGARLIKH